MNTFTFYHGTDARMVRMSEKERLQYLNSCNLTIDYLFELYEPLLEEVTIETQVNGMTCYVPNYKIDIEYKQLFFENNKEIVYRNLIEKIFMIKERNRGNQSYQYGYLFLTRDPSSAIDYARRSFAGGELGLIAYRLLEGMEFINFPEFSPSKEVQKAIEEVKEFGKEGLEEPVIITLDNLDIGQLLTEDGEQINMTFVKMGVGSYRYNGKIVLDLNKAEFLPTAKNQF